MIYIILSVICSVTVSVFLKLAKRYLINIPQVVLWNYLFAFILCCIAFKPSVFQIQQSISWTIYIVLGVLLPSIFWFLAASIKQIGIVKTDIAQRLSLFIPILAAYFLFNETFNTYKLIGLIIGFFAIFFTLYKKHTVAQESINWLFPVMVFVGFGVIDVLFKQVALNKAFPFITSLAIIFALAFVVSLLFVGYLRLTNQIKIQFINFVCGCILGLFNFGNIFFYLKAHQVLAKNPSTVFAAMNMGVIVVGSLVGIIIFKEKINKLNYLGITLAIMAIILITLSQIYAV